MTINRSTGGVVMAVAIALPGASGISGAFAQEEAACFGLRHETCKSSGGCIWLSPGCGHGPAYPPGCHQWSLCVDDGDCPSGLICTYVVWNPCALQDCDECFATGSVCFPRPGDSNGDGVVDETDFMALIDAWGPCAQCWADSDFDGVVGITDFLLLLANWG